MRRMGQFDGEFEDLSGYKILSFEEVTQGFEGNKNPLQGLLGIQNPEKIDIKDDEYINLTKLLGDIRSSYNGGKESKCNMYSTNIFRI
jgi:hypothetical protein